MNVYDRATTETYVRTFPANASKQMASSLVTDFILRQNITGALVDFGCGTGEDIALVEPLGIDYFGNDLSVDMLAYGRDNGAGRTVASDLGALPYRDDVFRTGISLWALQYKDDLETTLTEWNRVLCEDAPLLVVVPHPLYKFVKYSRDYFVTGEQWEDGLGIRRFNYYHPFGGYINALIGSGFTIEAIHEPQRKEDSREYFGITKRNIPHDLIIEARTAK